MQAGIIALWFTGLRNFTLILITLLFQNNRFAHKASIPPLKLAKNWGWATGKMNVWMKPNSGKGIGGALTTGLLSEMLVWYGSDWVHSETKPCLGQKLRSVGRSLTGKGIILNPLKVFQCKEPWLLYEEYYMHSWSKALPVTSTKRSWKTVSNGICPEAQ